MIDPNHRDLSVKSQCQLLGLNESTYYYKRTETDERYRFLQAVDETSLAFPEFGSRRIRDELCDLGEKCSREKVQNAMRFLGIEAKYPKPKLTKANPEHKKYPYLLRDLIIDRPNQVWCTDITYVRVKNGWAYLVAVMDWATRKILAWRLSNSMDVSFCIAALREALEMGTPEIFNTDQGSQFTCMEFTDILKSNQIKISMDGKGRALDNVMIERFWRTIKYEHLYLGELESITDTRLSISKYIDRYNTSRRHYGIQRRTPDEVYYAA